MPTPTPVTMDYPAPQTGGLLSQARSLPADWQRGIAFQDYSCMRPTVVGECPTSLDLDMNRPDTVEFQPVSLVQLVQCTTLGDTDVTAIADSVLDRVRDYALTRELLTSEASTRDANQAANVSLQDAATVVESNDSNVAALATLEWELAEQTASDGGVVFAGPAMITSLYAAHAIWRDGNRWRTPSGLPIIVSQGFDGRGPEDTGSPSGGDHFWLYAAATVWAETGTRQSWSTVDRKINDRSARVEDIALAAFPPCSVIAVKLPELTAGSPT